MGQMCPMGTAQQDGSSRVCAPYAMSPHFVSLHCSTQPGCAQAARMAAPGVHGVTVAVCV